MKSSAVPLGDESLSSGAAKAESTLVEGFFSPLQRFLPFAKEFKSWVPIAERFKDV